MFSKIPFINVLFQDILRKVNFEDVQIAIKSRDKFLIINTLSVGEQDCLIQGTLSFDMEEKIINEILTEYNTSEKTILIYGKNTNDASADNRCKQLMKLGFQKVFIYQGGMFEWLLLQDIYGHKEFPTTKKILDILKYKPPQTFHNRMLTYGS